MLVAQLTKPQTREIFTGLICKLRLDKSSDPQADNMGVKALIRRTLAAPRLLTHATENHAQHLRGSAGPSCDQRRLRPPCLARQRLWRQRSCALSPTPPFIPRRQFERPSLSAPPPSPSKSFVVCACCTRADLCSRVFAHRALVCSGTCRSPPARQGVRCQDGWVCLEPIRVCILPLRLCDDLQVRW